MLTSMASKTSISVLEALLAAQMPAPSLAVFSGRGLHLYWLLRATPGKALPVWQRIQDAILKTLSAIGADPACRDCTRVLRLPGTINSRNGVEARGLMLTGEEWDLQAWLMRFWALVAQVAPRPQFRLQRGGGSSWPTGPVLAGSIYGWWHTVYSDLVKLTNLEHGNRLPEGSRDRPCSSTRSRCPRLLSPMRSSPRS